MGAQFHLQTLVAALGISCRNKPIEDWGMEGFPGRRTAPALRKVKGQVSHS